jgi:SAM-dependent methyltransferase
MLAFVADYFGEATFGAAIVEPHLAMLPVDAKILEVGAGAQLLSCALQRAGFQVTALEPLAEGFSHIDRFRKIVVGVAAENGAVPAQLQMPAEALGIQSRFDFAFSINVMEHVLRVDIVFHRVLRALRPECGYRFVCPNYLFPYEPHFNIPTIFSKSITKRVFGRTILSSKRIVDPAKAWASLNWISVLSVRRICRSLGVEPVFDRELLSRYVARAVTDPSFQHRRSEILSSALRTFDRMGGVALCKGVPPVLQPALSCWIVRGKDFRCSEDETRG